MITFLNGFLWEKKEDGIVVDVSGVGYKVFMAGPSMNGLPDTGEPVFVYVYSHLREDESSLFGFLEEDARDFFVTLIGVSGIGPRGALKIMDQAPFQEITKAIVREDLTWLSSLSGIGKKTAERVILELRDKVKTYARAENEPEARKKEASVAEALDALRSLQFPLHQIREALAEVQKGVKEDLNTEELIRSALRYMGKG